MGLSYPFRMLVESAVMIIDAVYAFGKDLFRSQVFLQVLVRESRAEGGDPFADIPAE